MKKRLAVFASGEGTNFEVIAQACADGRLDAELVLMVCDRPAANVVHRAERFGIESFVFSPKDYSGKALYVFHCACLENDHLTVTLHP